MIALWEEAQKRVLFGIEVYAFGLYCAFGAGLYLLVLCMQCKRAGLKKGTAPLVGALSMAMGFIGARILFCGLDTTLSSGFSLPGVLMVTGGGYSMMGALFGAGAGVMLGAHWTHQSDRRLMDLAAPAMMLFVACERLGEGYIPDFGVSRPLLGDFFKGTFLAVEGAYEWCLATYLLESFAALVLAVVLLRDSGHAKKQGSTAILAMLLYGGVQTLMESLRYDRHMSLSFVGMQQVIAMMMLGIPLIVLALVKRRRRPKLSLAALISVPLTALLGVALEFAIDRTEINRYLLYAVYTLLLAVPLVLGIRLRKEDGNDGKMPD